MNKYKNNCKINKIHYYKKKYHNNQIKLKTKQMINNNLIIYKMIYRFFKTKKIRINNNK